VYRWPALGRRKPEGLAWCAWGACWCNKKKKSCHPCSFCVGQWPRGQGAGGTCHGSV